MGTEAGGGVGGDDDFPQTHKFNARLRNHTENTNQRDHGMPG